MEKQLWELLISLLNLCLKQRPGKRKINAFLEMNLQKWPTMSFFYTETFSHLCWQLTGLESSNNTLKEEIYISRAMDGSAWQPIIKLDTSVSWLSQSRFQLYSIQRHVFEGRDNFLTSSYEYKEETTHQSLTMRTVIQWHNPVHLLAWLTTEEKLTTIKHLPLPLQIYTAYVLLKAKKEAF